MPLLFDQLMTRTTAWRKDGSPSEHSAIAEISEWASSPDGSGFQLRTPQLRALETYWYLRLVKSTPKLFNLYQRIISYNLSRRLAKCARHPRGRVQRLEVQVPGPLEKHAGQGRFCPRTFLRSPPRNNGTAIPQLHSRSSNGSRENCAYSVRRVALPILILAVLGLTTTAFAWDQYAHMIVASVAYDQLTPSTRQKVRTLLKLNPKYHDWVARVSPDKRDRMAFLRASLWADDIKKADSGYIRDGAHNGNRPSNPDAASNIGYADKLQHKYWHFIDRPFSSDGTTLVNPSFPNVRTQIALFRATLSLPTASDDVKSYDLVWLLHLVADAHQPLHATSQFTQAQPEGDEGGNTVFVCWKHCKTRYRLHAFWDNVLGTSKSPSAAITKARELPPANPLRALVNDEAEWIEESFQIAQIYAYTSPIGVNSGPHVLTSAYLSAARKVAERRLALAGIRLANLLNEALK
jgi:hypothetical protein